MDDTKRTAIVTGGGSGLGRAICRRLARDNWRVAVCDVNRPGAEETVTEVNSAGGDGLAIELDVTEPTQWQSLRERLQSDWPQLDLLVNNAGVAGSGEVGHYTLDDWHWIMNVNLWGGIYGCHTLVDWLKENPRGAHIINTASLAAIASAPAMAAYNVTKAGMLALSETLYGELKPHGVGVTVVCPAFFATNLLEQGRFRHPQSRKLAESAFRQAKMTADHVADRAVTAMYRKQLYVIVPAQARFYWRLKRVAPMRFLNLIARQFSHRMQGNA